MTVRGKLTQEVPLRKFHVTVASNYYFTFLPLGIRDVELPRFNL